MPGNPCPSTSPSIDPKTFTGAEMFALLSSDPDNLNSKKQNISYTLQNTDSPFKVVGDKIVVGKVKWFWNFNFYFWNLGLVIRYWILYRTIPVRTQRVNTTAMVLRRCRIIVWMRYSKIIFTVKLLKYNDFYILGMSKKNIVPKK